jgi:hypothetical protein
MKTPPTHYYLEFGGRGAFMEIHSNYTKGQHGIGLSLGMVNVNQALFLRLDQSRSYQVRGPGYSSCSGGLSL